MNVNFVASSREVFVNETDLSGRLRKRQPVPKMAENNLRKKKISERQQKQLILMMRSYSAPGHPRSGPSIEYSEAFWKNVSQTLNLLESDPRCWRYQAQWRNSWRYYTARVKRMLKKNVTKENMTNFEKEIAIFLQQNFFEGSDIQVEEEDEDSMENIQVQPDINETLPDEPVVMPVRAQPIQRRRKTVGFVDQANIDQAGQHSQDTYFEPMPLTSYNNTNATQTQTHQTQTNKTDFVQPSILTNQNIKSEPGTLQAPPSPSTSRQDANSVTNDRNRKRDEDNSADDKLTRQLAALIKSGEQMAQIYLQTVSSIAEIFQEMREERRRETIVNINGFRTENNGN